MSLTVVAVNAAKSKENPYKLFDGGGLFLLVSPTGFKSWNLAYRWNGAQTQVSLGTYPRIGLQEARSRRDQAKAQIDSGINPSAAKKMARVIAARAAVSTFEAVAREWHARQSKTLDETYATRVIRFLEADIFPHIGHKDIAEIEPLELLGTIQRIERRGAADLPRRLLRTCGQVFRYAIATGRLKHDPSHAIKDALAPRGRVRHRASFKESELPVFFERLSIFEGQWTTAAAIRFIWLTVVRTDELRFGVRSEIEDLDGKTPLWRIPAERMKMKREHVIPLSPAAVAILKESFGRYPDSKWLFTSEESRTGALSENAMLYALYRMGYHGKATIHGVRGTFSTIANEAELNRDHIELQLAHGSDDAVRSAYNSALYLPQRRKLLNWWADALTGYGMAA